MFADLDESLKQLLIREVPLGAKDVDVVFEMFFRVRSAARVPFDDTEHFQAP